MEHRVSQSQRISKELLYWELDLIDDMCNPRISPERWITGVDLLRNAVGMADIVINQEECWEDLQHALRVVRRTLWGGLSWMADRREEVGDINALAREVAHALWASQLMRRRLWLITNTRGQARYEPVRYRYTAWAAAGQLVSRALRDH